MVYTPTYSLRLVDGVTGTTIDLNDGINYDIDADAAWSPELALDEYAEVVTDPPIGVNILKGTTARGTMTNLRALIALLRTANRAALDGVGGVKLQYTPPNVYPKARWSAIVLDWNEVSFLPSEINEAGNLATAQRIEGCALQLTRRHPWVRESYVYANLVAGTAWSVSDPNWALGSTSGSPVRTWIVDQSLPYGGSGFQRITWASNGGALLTSPSGLLSVINGQMYTVLLRVAGSATGNLSLVLRNSGNSANISNVASAQAIIGAGSIYSESTSQWLAFQLTATATDANARLQLVFSSMTAGTVDIGELKIVQGALAAEDDRWSPKYSEISQTSAGSPIGVTNVTTINLPGGTTYAPTPVDWLMGLSGAGGSYADAWRTGVTILSSGNIEPTPLSGLTGTDLASFPAGNLAWPTGNVLRMTPTAPNFWRNTSVIAPAALNMQRVGFILVAQNGSPSATYLVKAGGALRGNVRWYETLPVAIDPYSGSAAPAFYHLGELMHPEGFWSFRLSMLASAIGTGVLDMNRLIIYGINDDTTVISHVDVLDIVMPWYAQGSSNWLTTGDARYQLRTSGSTFVEDVPSFDDPRYLAPAGVTSIRYYIDGVSGSKWQLSNNGTSAETYTLSLTIYPAAEFPY